MLSTVTPRLITTIVASCVLALAIAAPGIAKPAGHGPARQCVGCERPTAGIPTGSLAGTTSSTPVPGTIQTSSLAGTTSSTPVPVPAARPSRPHAVGADDGGVATLAVILIGAAALLAGASAGFAGGRRTAARAA